MHRIRNKLLVALVLFGVFFAGVTMAQAASVGIGYLPTDPSGRGTLQPGAAPNTGEPDVTQSGSPQPTRINSMTPTRRPDAPVLQPQSRSAVPLADVLRWAWVIWQAQYLNRVNE